jgi:hypothetical protein
MGHLNVGATYIYERNGEEIYAREAGQTNRVLIGYQYEGQTDPRTDDGRPLHEHLREDQLWSKIRRTARTNPALQSELERVIMLYNLINSEK